MGIRYKNGKVTIACTLSLLMLFSAGIPATPIQAAEGGDNNVLLEPMRHYPDKWAVAPLIDQADAPVIDGTTSENIWQTAAVLNGFGTAFYEEAATHHAEYKLAYDGSSLYIAGSLDRPAADMLAQIEIVIRPADEKAAFYALRIPLATAQPPSLQTVWNPDMNDINTTADIGRRNIANARYATSQDTAKLRVEAAIPLSEIAPAGVTSGTEWGINVIHLPNLYVAPLDSWVPVRNVNHWHAGGPDGRVVGDVIGQQRLGSLFFSAVPARFASLPGGAAEWRPALAELAYTGFTGKRLTISTPAAGLTSADTRLFWKAPGGDWQTLAIDAFALNGATAAIDFQHPAAAKDGVYQLAVAFSPSGAGQTKVALLSFDREHAIEASLAAYTAPGPSGSVRNVTWSEPSTAVSNALTLIPPQPGFIFVGLPEMPELYPQSLYQLSADGHSMTAARTGTVYPNALFPENERLTVLNGKGETVEIPYYEAGDGTKYFITGQMWYLQKQRALTQTASIAKTDPLGAARLLLRFAEAYGSYNPTVDRIGGSTLINYSANKASGPPYAYWGGVWDRWWYNDLPQLRPLMDAYTEVKKTNAFDLLSASLGEDVERKIVQEMFIPSADLVLTHVNRYSNMSLQPWIGLIALGKALGEPDYIHRAVESIEAFTARMYLSDGFWQEVTPSYHIQTVSGLQSALNLLKGWSDPAGYVSPRTGMHFDNLDMAQQFPIINRALDAANRLVYPDGKVLPVMDTWAAERPSQPKTDEGPLLLPSAGIGRLSGGQGTGQTMLYMGFQPKYGHVHFDPLNLSLFAGGQELLPDLGYTHSSKYRYFSLSTMGHNTVVVNGKNMPFGESSKDGGSIQSFVANGGAFQAMRADYEGAYPETSEYSREPWFVPFPGGTAEQGYVLDLFRVSGGSRHEYTLQGDANRDAAFLTSLPLTDYGPYLVPPGTVVVEPTNNNDSGSAEGHYPGYIYVRDVKQAQLQDDRYNVSLVTYAEGAEKMKMNITGLLEPGTNELYLGRSPSLRAIRVQGRAMDNNDEVDKYDMPKLVLRRDGTNLESSFVTLMEPFTGEQPRIEAIDRLVPEQAPEGAVAVRIAYGDTIDILLSNPRHPEQPIQVGDVTMRGQMGLIRLKDGAVRDLTLYGGTLLKKGDTELVGAGAAAGTVTDTLRRAKGDAYDAIVTDIPVSRDAIGRYVLVKHPDGSKQGFLIRDIVSSPGRTAIVLAEHDPGFEIRADGSSEQMFFPSKQWTGAHTFEIGNIERASELTGNPGNLRTGTVTGSVYAEGEPVVGAAVHPTGYGTPSALTDNSGRFTLAGVPEGRQRVTVSAPGYALNVSQAVYVTQGQTANIALSLTGRLPPVLTNITPNGAVAGDPVHATSSSDGHIYLVPSGTPRQAQAIELAATPVSGAVYGVKAAATAQVPVELSTSGLAPGYYTLYAINQTGVSTGSPIVLVPGDMTVIQDTYSLIRYSGTWLKLESASYSGGTMMLGRVKGDYADIPFYGSSAKIVADLHTARGKGNIYVDGVFKTTVDFYSPTIKYRQELFDTGPLSEGVHVIRIEVTGEKQAASSGINVSFDSLLVFKNRYALTDTTAGAVAVGQTVAATSPKSGALHLVPEATADNRAAIEAAAAAGGRTVSITAGAAGHIDTTSLPLGWYRLYAVDSRGDVSLGSGPIAVINPLAQAANIDDNDPLVLYKGDWRTYLSPLYAGGSLVLGFQGGSSAEIPFYGTRAKLVGDKRPLRGKGAVYVDGVYKATVDFYNPTTIIYKQEVFDTGLLPAGPHTIRIVTLWEKNEAATGYYVPFDELRVTAP
ncbi:carboxypeptidase regulatory-like domain-containing protein [Paenibacillus hodogayensis]|uniref:Carboxypeptidase regulatory-like domain-containing protein n=1 Tax=Paenibacillus hodogayensis TaxID=279208 RepID=A0ABV5W607_9BACL